VIGRGFQNGFRSDWCDIAVACPACGSCAVFTRPFQILEGEEAEKAAADPRIRGHRHLGRFAVERFPELFSWNDPDNRIINFRGPPAHWGVISCCHCPFRKKHRLSWPVEAFYKIELPCGPLWATSRSELLLMRQCFGGAPGKWYQFTNRLPKEFFLHRNRDLVLRGIDELLARPERA
jgi:hypothetical protein